MKPARPARRVASVADLRELLGSALPAVPTPPRGAASAPQRTAGPGKPLATGKPPSPASRPPVGAPSARPAAAEPVSAQLRPGPIPPVTRAAVALVTAARASTPTVVRTSVLPSLNSETGSSTRADLGGDTLADFAGVKRLPPSDRLPPSLKPPPAVPRPLQQVLDDAAVMAELLEDPLALEDFESGETLSYRGETLSDSSWRKLKRGQYRLQGEVDLHGYGREAAREAVIRFFVLCKARDFRCVRIIHGKGNGSPNTGPVLKRVMDGWLRRRRDVLGFCSARPWDGGTGAIYVLLKNER